MEVAKSNEIRIDWRLLLWWLSMQDSLDLNFAAQGIDPRLNWFCPPSVVPTVTPRGLRLTPDAKTDFWQVTHYGFAADNGHFLFANFAGDFILWTRIRMKGIHRYDQAGLMVRCSPKCWLKTSVEFEPDGPGRLGAVVTNHGYSDWSTQDYAAGEVDLHLRVRREANDYIVESSADGTCWTQIRMARLLEDAGTGQPIAAGLYACSPTAAGFATEFEFLRLTLGRA